MRESRLEEITQPRFNYNDKVKELLGGSAFELLSTAVWTIDYLNYWLFELLFIWTTDNNVISCSSKFKQHIIYSFELLNMQFKIFIFHKKIYRSNNHHNISKMTYIVQMN